MRSTCAEDIGCTTEQDDVCDFLSSASKVVVNSQAKVFYSQFLEKVRREYQAVRVKDGVFGAMMDVSLVNDVRPMFMQRSVRQHFSQIWQGKMQIATHPQPERVYLMPLDSLAAQNWRWEVVDFCGSCQARSHQTWVWCRALSLSILTHRTPLDGADSAAAGQRGARTIR